MKSKGWRATPRWEWERTKKVVVFAKDDKLSIPKSKVIRCIQELLDELAIPLDVIDGNLKHSADLALIEENLCQSMKNNEIDYNEFEEKLRKVRGTGRLSYGMVMLVDKERYGFYNRPGEQQAIYGIGVENGLVILRCTHKESVRHEFAHMLGLVAHHQPPKHGCIMNWECDISMFCDDCKQEIAEMWKGEIKAGKNRKG